MTKDSIPFKPSSIGMGALIAVCLYISGLLVILTPLPLVYVSATAGRKNGIFSAALAFILVSALYIAAFLVAPIAIPLPGLALTSHFSSWAIQIFGGGYFLFFIVIALVLGEAVRSHWGLLRGGGTALVAGLALSLLVAVAIHFSGAAHLLAGIRSYLEYMVSEIARLQQAAGVSNVQTALLSEHGPEVASFVFYIIPSLIFVFALVAVVVNLLFSRRFIRMPHLFSGHAWDVAAFRISDVVIWAVIAAACVFFAGRYVIHTEWLEFLGINAIIGLAAVYFFQGLAVTAFFLRRIKMPLLRIAAYIFIILFFQTVGILVVGFGLADVWVDFRRRAHKVHTVDTE